MYSGGLPSGAELLTFERMHEPPRAQASLPPSSPRQPRLLSCLVLIAAAVVSSATSARAQENSAQEAARQKAALASLPKDAARRAFGTVRTPAAGEGRIIGEYWKGCFSGGMRFPADGKHWQVMRLSRNRNWGHPYVLDFLERFARTASQVTGWPGLLIGDMSQPRGGPMLTGHSSHQLGIEIDIWLRPMPARRLTPKEREDSFSTSLLRRDRKDVDPSVYSRQHLALLRAAASQPEVARVFVNAGIKKALCRDAGSDRAWLRKIRPAAGHDYHFHIRLACPPGQPQCIDQAPPTGGDGCGKELDYWFREGILHPKPGAPGKAMSVSAMPAACRALLQAPAASPGPPPKPLDPRR